MTGADPLARRRRGATTPARCVEHGPTRARRRLERRGVPGAALRQLLRVVDAPAAVLPQRLRLRLRRARSSYLDAARHDVDYRGFDSRRRWSTSARGDAPAGARCQLRRRRRRARAGRLHASRAASSTSSSTSTTRRGTRYVVETLGTLAAAQHARLRVQHADELLRRRAHAATTSTTATRRATSTCCKRELSRTWRCCTTTGSTSSRSSCGKDASDERSRRRDLRRRRLRARRARLPHARQPARGRGLHRRRELPSTATSFAGLPVVAVRGARARRYPPDDFAMFVAIGFSGVNQVRAEMYERVQGARATSSSATSARARSCWATIDARRQLFIFEDNMIQPFVTHRQRRDALERQPHRPRLDDRRPLLHRLARRRLRQRDDRRSLLRRRQRDVPRRHHGRAATA